MAKYSFVDVAPKASRFSFVDDEAKTPDSQPFMERVTGAFKMGMEASTNYIRNAERFLAGTEEDDDAIASSIVADMAERQQFGKTAGQKKLDDAMQELNKVKRGQSFVDDVGEFVDKTPDMPFMPGVKTGAKAAVEFARSLPEIWDVVKTAGENPLDTVVSSAESAANSLFALGGGTAGGAAGAAIGGTAGLLTTKSAAGAAAGAKVGAKVGGQAGMFGTSAAIEFGASLQEEVIDELERRGTAPTTENIKALLKEPEFRTEALKVAAAKGVVTPATDLAMFRLSGGLGAVPGVKGKLAALASEAISEPLSEGTGQAAQVAVSSDPNRQIDRSELAAEAIYALPTSAGSAAAATLFEKVVGDKKTARPDTPTAKQFQDAEAQLNSLDQQYQEATATGDTELADALKARFDTLKTQYETFRKAKDPNYVGTLNPKQAIDEAGDQALAAGGDRLDAEIAKSHTAIDVIPAARTAQDLGVTFPDPQSYAVEGLKAGQVPDQRHSASMEGIDGLIIAARRMGFADEEAKLATAKRLFTQYKDALDSGQGEMADRYLQQGNKLYRDATGDNGPLAPVRSQFPVPYVFQGEVSGSTNIVPSTRPNFTTSDAVDVDGMAWEPTRQNRLENQSQGKLTTDGTIYGQPPAREFTPPPTTYEGVGRNAVDRTAARPVGIEAQPGVQGRSISTRDLMQPATLWTGGMPEGYKTENGAKLARLLKRCPDARKGFVHGGF